MGFSRRRPGKDGKPRYTAYYRDLRGREVSAGTFARKGPDAEDAPIHLASARQLAAASAVPGLKISSRSFLRRPVGPCGASIWTSPALCRVGVAESCTCRVLAHADRLFGRILGCEARHCNG